MSLNNEFNGKIVMEKSKYAWGPNEQPIYIVKEKTNNIWKLIVLHPGFHISLSAGATLDFNDSFMREYTDAYD
jgi:hypothetical protein